MDRINTKAVMMATIAMARRYPGLNENTVIKTARAGSEFVYAFKMDRADLDDPIKDRTIDKERIPMLLYQDGTGLLHGYLLIGYGPKTDTLAIAPIGDRLIKIVMDAEHVRRLSMYPLTGTH